MLHSKIVLFDGICVLCNRMVNFIWNHNSKKNLYYASLQSDYAKKYLTKQGYKNIELNTIIFIDGIKIYTKSEAILMILKNLDGRYPLLSKIFCLIPQYISDSLYKLIAKNRYRIFGTQVTCKIINQEESWFLD